VDEKLLEETKSLGRRTTKTVVFVRERDQVVNLWSFFTHHLENKELVQMYMSTTADRMKKKIALDFKEENSIIRILIATSAFGLGVDCRGIRRVVHLQPPHDLDEYVQEIGRAGRGGELAAAIVFQDHTAKCDKAMKEYLALSTCRRQYLQSVYFSTTMPVPPPPPPPSSSLPHCCSICRGN
jgi:ATP-dependent DNA helicase RecQ